MNAFSWRHSAPESDLTLERDVKRRITKLYRTLGCKVYSLSQPKRSGQTPGLPDMLIKHGPRGISWTHESKTKNGRLSGDQREFGDLCLLCHDHHVVGGYDAAVTFLKAQGFLAPEWVP